MSTFIDPAAAALAHLPVTVGFGRFALDSRWQASAWRLLWVRPAGGARPAAQAAPHAADGALEHVANDTHVAVHRDEAEGYWLNLTATEPSIFVLWRADDEAAPCALGATLSYHEAGRWMDGGQTVDRVPMPPEMVEWLADWVRDNYRPQQRTRQRGPKPSFMSRDEFERFARGGTDSATPPGPGGRSGREGAR